MHQTIPRDCFYTLNIDSGEIRILGNKEMFIQDLSHYIYGYSVKSLDIVVKRYDGKQDCYQNVCYLDGRGKIVDPNDHLREVLRYYDEQPWSKFSDYR